MFKVGNIWHYRFQIDGKPIQRTTRQTKMPLADDIATVAFEAAQHAWQGRRLSTTINDLAKQWLEVYRLRTSRAYQKSVEAFLRLHLYELDGQLVCDITTSMVEKALNAHLTTHALDSGNQWLKILRMLTRWAIAGCALASMPWKVGLTKVQKKPRAVLPSSKTVPWLEAVDQASRWFNLINEGKWISIFIVGNVLKNFGLQAWFIPAIILIVGLHFFPLAWLFKARRHVAIGMALTVWAIGYPLSVRLGPLDPIGCLGAGLILWVAALSALRSGFALQHSPLRS